jgi:voltage-gated potassium channel
MTRFPLSRIVDLRSSDLDVEHWERSPFRRIQVGAVLLAVVFVVAVCGYHFLADYDWVDAVWMVVVTISTVGYSERSSLSPTLQFFSIMVILFGMSAAAYTFGGLIQMMLEGELEQLLGVRRMTKDLQRLENHTIVCGYGRMGHRVVEELRPRDQNLVVLEKDADVVAKARTLSGLFVVGDATEEAALKRVSIERAKTLVAALPTDAENVFITLTARNLNPTVQIISRAEKLSTETKLKQAGADRVVMPSVVGARQLVRMITRPTTADLIELVYEADFLDFELDELRIPASNKLIGQCIDESLMHRKHKLLIVAVKKADGQLVFNPDREYCFEADDIIILMGHSQDINKFRAEYDL